MARRCLLSSLPLPPLPLPPPSPCTFRVRGERGEEKLLAYRFAGDVDVRVLAHGTVIELGKEVLAKRSDDTPRCSLSTRERVRESGGNLRVVLFIRVPPVALYPRWRERTKRETKCDWHLGGGEEYPLPLLSPSPLLPRRGARTRQKRRRPPQAFSLVADESSFSSANSSDTDIRFPLGGRKGNTCPIPKTHRVLSLSRYPNRPFSPPPDD